MKMAVTKIHKYTGKIIIKVVSTATLMSFILTSLIPFSANATIITLEAPTSVKRDINADIREGTISIPVSIGEIKDMHFGKSGKTIIHIQDAHCNYYAQRSIKSIIDYFNSTYGLNMLLLEGGEGGYDLSSFTNISDPALREKVADFFLKQGNLNAAEYISVLEPGKFILWGVEEEDLYRENLSVYRRSTEYQEDVKKYLKNLENILERLKKRIYPKDLLEFDNKYTLYKNSEMEFQDYILYLFSLAKVHFIDLKSYPNLYLLGEVLEQEKDIDFKKAGKERDLYIEELRKSISENQMAELLRYTVSFKSGDISQREYYNYLIKIGKESDIALDDYPFFKRFAIYTSIYEAIDKSLMMRELNSLEDTLKGHMVESDEQRKLVFYSKNFGLMQRAFDFSLTKDDFDYFREYMGNFDINGLLKFILDIIPKYKMTVTIPDETKDLEKRLSEIKEFYTYSFERDDVFLKNADSKMKDENIETAILFTGGFHSDNLAEIFKKKGISYVSIMPHFKDPEDYESPYFDILGGGYTDLGSAIMSAVSFSNMQVASIWNRLGKIIEGPLRSNLANMQIDIARRLALGEDAIVEIAGSDRVLRFFSDAEGKVDYELINRPATGEAPQIRIKNLDAMEYEDHERIIDRQISDAYLDGRVSGMPQELLDRAAEFFDAIGQSDVGDALRFREIDVNEVEGVELFQGHASWRGININRDHFTDRPSVEKMRTLIHEIGAYYLQSPETNSLLETEYDRWNSGIRKTLARVPVIDTVNHLTAPGPARERDYAMTDFGVLAYSKEALAEEITKILFLNVDTPGEEIYFNSSGEGEKRMIAEVNTTIDALINRFSKILITDRDSKTKRETKELMIALLAFRVVLAFGTRDNVSEDFVLDNFAGFLVDNEWENTAEPQDIGSMETAIEDRITGKVLSMNVNNRSAFSSIDSMLKLYAEEKSPKIVNNLGYPEPISEGSVLEPGNINDFLMVIGQVISDRKEAADTARTERKKVKIANYLINSVDFLSKIPGRVTYADGSEIEEETREKYAGAVTFVLRSEDPAGAIESLIARNIKGYTSTDFNAGMGIFFKPLGFKRRLAEISVFRGLSFLEYEEYVKELYPIAAPEDYVSYYDYKMMEGTRDVILRSTWIREFSAYLLMGGLRQNAEHGGDFIRLANREESSKRNLSAEFLLNQKTELEESDRTAAATSPRALLLHIYAESLITGRDTVIHGSNRERLEFARSLADREFDNYLKFHEYVFSLPDMSSTAPPPMSKDELVNKLYLISTRSEMIEREFTHALRPWTDEPARRVRAGRPEAKWAAGLKKYRSLSKVFEDFFENEKEEIALRLNISDPASLVINQLNYVGEIAENRPGYDKVMFQVEVASGDGTRTFIVSIWKNSSMEFSDTGLPAAGLPIKDTWLIQHLKNTATLADFKRESFQEKAPMMYEDMTFRYDGNTFVIVSEFALETEVTFSSDGVVAAVGEMINAWLDVTSGLIVDEGSFIELARVNVPEDMIFKEEPVIEIPVSILRNLNISEIVNFLHEEIIPRLDVEDRGAFESRILEVIGEKIAEYKLPTGSEPIAVSQMREGVSSQEIIDRALAYIQGYSGMFSLRNEPDFFKLVNDNMIKVLKTQIEADKFPEGVRGDAVVADRLNRRLDALKEGYREATIDAFITVAGRKMGFSDPDDFVTAMKDRKNGDERAIVDWIERNPYEDPVPSTTKSNIGRLLAEIYILTALDTDMQAIGEVAGADKGEYGDMVMKTLIMGYEEYKDISNKFDIENTPLGFSDFIKLSGMQLYFNGIETVPPAATGARSASGMRNKLIDALDYIFEGIPQQGTLRTLFNLGTRVFSAGAKKPVDEAVRSITPRFKQLLLPAEERKDSTLNQVMEDIDGTETIEWLQKRLLVPSRENSDVLIFGMGNILADFTRDKGWGHADYVQLAERINDEMSKWAQAMGNKVQFNKIKILRDKTAYDQGRLKEGGNPDESGFARWLDDEDIGDESQAIRDQQDMFRPMSQESSFLNNDVDLTLISEASGVPKENIRVIDYDIGLTTGAFQFMDGQNLVIVRNTNTDFISRVEEGLEGRDAYSYETVLNEILFHEAREAYWTRAVTDSWDSWDLPEGMTPASVAHIIASAEQAAEFGLSKTDDLGGVTPYHYAALRSMKAGTLERKLSEDRDIHDFIIASARNSGELRTNTATNERYKDMFTANMETFLEREEGKDLASAEDIDKAAVEVSVSLDMDRDGIVEAIVDSGKDIRFKKRNVQVLTGFLASPELSGAMGRVNRKFNTEIKLRFGSKRDNQQVRTFALTEGASREDNIKAFLSELAKTYRSFENNYKGEEDTLVVFAPQIDAWTQDGDPKEVIASWAGEADLNESDSRSIADALSDGKVMVAKDTYSDWSGDTPGDIRLPDIAMRFVLARHMAALKNAKNEGTREDIFRDIIDLLILRSSGDAAVSERLEKALDEIGTGNVTQLLNSIIIDITPIPYDEIPQYADMIREVAVSL